MEAIRRELLFWYDRHKRDLPWRSTRDPYLIWVSEVILQQTRVAQGTPYYHRFTERFPDVVSLAVAGEGEVLKEWEGLGYYSRARNLHRAARQVVQEYDGRVPGTYDELLKLKGVGPYTAAAIASIAYGEPVPLVDGNVARVISRLFGLEVPVETTSFRKQAIRILGELMDASDPGRFNQALMEFGAVQCVPGKPDCFACPLRLHCVALAQVRVDNLPLKTKVLKGRVRHFNYFVPLLDLDGEEFTMIRKRIKKDIWQHLCEFPLIETERAVDLIELLPMLKQEGIHFGGGQIIESSGYGSRHVLSHRVIQAVFYRIRADIDAGSAIPEGYQLVSMGELRQHPFSRLIINYLDRAGM